MSLVSGYFHINGKMTDNIVCQKIESFDITGSESRQAFKTIVFKGCHGHIAAKFKVEAPIQVRYKGGQNWDVITLGFHDIDYGPEFSGGGAGCGRYDELSLSDPASQIETSEGEFVSLLLEKDSDRVHVINDRFGSRPFYILQSSEAFVFSSNLAFLVYLYGQRLNPDPLGWLQIFSYGRTLGEKTNFLGVERLKPGSHVIMSKVGISKRQYWRLRHDAQNGLEPERYAEKVFDAFERSVRARIAFFNKGFVSLSGGLDSRLAAAAIPKEADFYTFTIADSVDDEDTIQIKTAREISRILGRRHHIRRIPRDGISKIASEVVRLTGGLAPIHHPCKTFRALLEMRQSSGFKMGGGPGDSLAGSYVSSSIHNINEQMTDIQVRKFIVRHRRFSRKVLSKVFSRELVDEYFPKLDEFMSERFAELSGIIAAQKISAWGMVFRQPAFTFTSPIHTHPDVTEASPHLGYEYADLILANSNYTYQSLLELGANPEKLVLHPEGFNATIFCDLDRPEHEEKEDKIIIITVARLVEVKGIKYGIEAFSSLVKKYPEKSLVYHIIGSGPLEDEMKALVKKLSLEKKVFFLGVLDQNKVVEHLREADIFMLPSIAEAMGVVLLEAQAVGLPVVSTLVGGIPQAVRSGESGFLVPAKEPDALAEKLVCLVENRQLRRQMGKCGRKYVLENFAFDKLNQKLVSIFEELLRRDSK